MITTKNIPTSSTTPKVIQPGNVVCKINAITLDSVPYKKGAYNFNLHLETLPIENFEGFLIDKDNPDSERYLGQIGRVRYSEWPFSDGQTKTGVIISRDTEILKAIQYICKQANCVEWLESQDGLHSTIESLVEEFNNAKPFKDIYFEFCIGGREYLNKANYTNYDLYLPKAVKGMVNMKRVTDMSQTKLMPFSEENHIKKSKTESVTSFSEEEGVVTTKVYKDFNLD